MELTKDQIVEGVITGITNFGAFVKIDDRTTGLVHISEISNEYVKDIRDIHRVGDQVKVKVLKIEDGGKIVLSIKRVLDQPMAAPRPQQSFAPRKKVQEASKPENFEDRLAKFLKMSEEIQLDSKRSQDLSRKRKKKN